MQNLREKLHLKAGRLRNVTIASNNLIFLPVYERGGKALEGTFKTYKDALPEGEYTVGKQTFNDIVKLLTMCGDSKYDVSTYYIKL